MTTFLTDEGNLILFRKGKWCVLSKDGKWVLSRHPTVGSAKAWKRHRGLSSRRCIRVALQGAQIRTAMFEEREHVVVPVVALVEGVIHAVNSDFPELVLAEEFAKAPQGWNGRPVLPNHPSSMQGKVSANDPRVLETQAFGRVFHTKVDGKKLLMEAWLDPARAEKVGPDAQRILERVRTGDAVEVSVGVFVVTEDKSGTHDGMPFAAVWHEIVPDHLAMLPEGTKGACSVEMGCGAPRVAAANGKEGERMKLSKSAAAVINTLKAQQQFRDNVLEVMHFRTSAEEDMSDTEIRQALDAALRAVEPGYLGVDSVFLDSNQVVYAVAPEDGIQLFRRSFEMGADNAVSLKDDREEVKPVTRFEAATADPDAPPVTEPKHACGCGTQARPTPTTPATQEDRTMSQTKKERVAALMARLAAKAPKQFKPEDAVLLESWPDEKLDEIEANLDKALEARIKAAIGIVAATETTPAKTDPATPAATKTTPETEEEFLAQAPESIKTVFAEHKAAQGKKKADLITAIKSTKQKVYTDDELKAMEIPQLEKLVALSGAEKKVLTPDFSGKNPQPRAAEGEEDETVPVVTSNTLRDLIVSDRAK